MAASSSAARIKRCSGTTGSTPRCGRSSSRKMRSAIQRKRSADVWRRVECPIAARTVGPLYGRAGGFSRSRKRNLYCSADAPGATLKLDLGTMTLGNLANDGESQATAFTAAVQRAVEPLEDTLAFRLRYARPGVFH